MNATRTADSMCVFIYIYIYIEIHIRIELYIPFCSLEACACKLDDVLGFVGGFGLKPKTGTVKCLELMA